VTFVDCPREQDVIDALTTSQWPDRCDDELRSHVAGCQSCQDLVTIVAPVGNAWAESRADAHVPASGTVWWRAQMRARQEAARAAARPIAIVPTVAAVAAATILAAVLFAISPWLAASFASSREFLTVDVSKLQPLQGWLLAGGAAALLGIGSLAVYFVVAED
jgi:hypothetical protein